MTDSGAGSIEPKIRKEINESLVDDTADNPKGIPSSRFIEKVEEFVGSKDPEDFLKCLHELHGKYQYLQQNYLQTKSATMQKLPDIKAALAAVMHIKKKQDADEMVETQFNLSDNVYVSATIPPNDKVALWLGANVMLEYSLDEARALLGKNKAAADENIADLDAALLCLRDQLTTTEVNIARVHNYNVKARAEKRAAESAGDA